MEVSVIIPAYKAELFIEKAIKSAIVLKEVIEVIVVIDGEFDNTASIVKKIANENSKVKLLYHPNQENRGAAASRNLGIKNASSKFIAFLDADDFYLENRFQETNNVFNKYSDADGVYEAIGLHAYDEISYKKHIDRVNACNIEGLNPELTTLTERVDPDKLFETIVWGKKGWFHFNGLTLKRSVFDNIGFITEELNRYGEDNEFFLRLAFSAKLYPGDLIQPVAMRGVYRDNVTLNTFEDSEILLKTYKGSVYFQKFVFQKIFERKFDKRFNRFVLMRYLDSYSIKFMMLPNSYKRKFFKFIHLLITFIKHPSLLLKTI